VVRHPVKDEKEELKNHQRGEAKREWGVRKWYEEVSDVIVL